MILILIIKACNQSAVAKADQLYIIFILAFKLSEQKQKGDAEFGEVRSLF